MGQDQISILQRADVIERRLADGGIAREEPVRRHGGFVPLRSNCPNRDVDLSRGRATGWLRPNLRFGRGSVLVSRSSYNTLAPGSFGALLEF